MISMRRTIFRRIAVVVIISVALVSVCFTAVLYNEIALQVRGGVRSQALLIAQTLDWGKNPESDDVTTLRTLALADAPFRITLIAADGTPLFDSQAQTSTMGNHANRPEVKEARATGAGQAERQSATIGKKTYYYAKLLQDGRVLRVAETTDTVYGLFFRQLPVILVVVICVLLISLAVARGLTRSLVRPIAEGGLESGPGSGASGKVVYEELAPYIEQRERADKLRRQFSANVSHELKTPLTSIVGRAELLENGLVKPNDVADFGASIRIEGQRLLELIEDVMRLSQLDESDEPKMQRFEVQGVITDVLASLESKAVAAQVTLGAAGESVELNADRNMMFELLYNLVDNAIKYNRVDGTVTVRAVREAAGPVIEVIDTGIGIPVADSERIFERFYRVDRSRSKETGGTGLGLSIVKHIAAHHGAIVELESEQEGEQGSGTTVRIRF